MRNPSFSYSYQVMPYSLIPCQDTKYRRGVLRYFWMETLNILRIYFNIFVLSLWHREITAIELFFNKVAGCHLTKKGLHHSFFRMNFAKVFRSEIKYFSSFCSFTSVLIQHSIVKNLFKSHRKITAMGFFFREIAGFEVNEGLFLKLGFTPCKAEHWTLTTRHGVTRKEAQKRLQDTENLFRKNLHLKDVC